MDSLKFVKNFERLFAVQYMRQNARMWYSIGGPKATNTHPVEYLKKKASLAFIVIKTPVDTVLQMDYLL